MRSQGHRWFAALYDGCMRGVETGQLARLRQHVVEPAMGIVLDVGAGTGINFPYYKHADRVIAIDPDPHMLRRAERRAVALGGLVHCQQAPAEALPFPDHSFDTIVITLVLCSVTDVPRALAEARRVLRPGGSLRFIEHVRASDERWHGWAGRLQDVLTPVQRVCAAGCHLNRPTERSIVAAGFEVQDIQRTQLASLPFIAGVARAPIA